MEETRHMRSLCDAAIPLEHMSPRTSPACARVGALRASAPLLKGTPLDICWWHSAVSPPGELISSSHENFVPEQAACRSIAMSICLLQHRSCVLSEGKRSGLIVLRNKPCCASLGRLCFRLLSVFIDSLIGTAHPSSRLLLLDDTCFSSSR